MRVTHAKTTSTLRCTFAVGQCIYDRFHLHTPCWGSYHWHLIWNTWLPFHGFEVVVNIGVCILFHVTYLHCCAFGSSDCIYHLICMCDLFKFITLICRHCLNETLFACSNILKKSTSQAKVNDCTVCFQECKLIFFINIGTRIKIFKQKKKNH